jgi:DNA polymerase III sliding clamp (beta) subunit (PCNA family)
VKEFRALPNVITLHAKPLSKAIKAARNNDSIHLKMMAQQVMVIAKMDDATTKVSFKYETTNQTDASYITVPINPKYLLDALSGMTARDAVTIKYNHERVYLTDGEREACIMAMRMG